VARLAYRLECELDGRPAEEAELAVYVATAERLLGSDVGFWALLVEDESGEALGVLTLNQCAALYTHGLFGEIAELYVVPEQRSAKLGAALMAEAVAFARARGWTRLEVGADAPPKWQRSVDFYLSQGFKEVGPRLKLVF